MNKLSQLKQKERFIVDKLVKLSHYNKVNTKDDFIKLLDVQIEHIKNEEDNLFSQAISDMENIGFKKTIYTYVRNKLEEIKKGLSDSGQLSNDYNSQLQTIRKQINEIESGNNNRSVLDHGR